MDTGSIPVTSTNGFIMTRKRISLIVVFLFVLASPVFARARLKEIRYHSYPDKTRIVAEVAGVAAASRYKANKISSQTISLSIPDLASTLRQKSWVINDGLVKDIYVSSPSRGKFTINLENKGWDYHVFSLRNPPRVIIDISKNSSQEEQVPAVFLKTIVIDAGHGGKDPGAVGPTGLKEKDVTLDIAKRLKQILQKHAVRVILTRDRDEFVSLQRRVSVANSSGVDLFVSIHCNAAFSSRACGFESYFLSPASDDLARAVETVENSVIMLEANSSNKDKQFLTILADLKYTEYRTESKMLATMVQKNLDKRLSTPNRGVKSALFYVLKGLEAPAVLVEMGFISNPSEERLFRSYRHRHLLAQQIAESVLQFKKEFDITAGFTK